MLMPGSGWGESFSDLPKHDCRDAGGRVPKVGALGDAGAVAEGRFGTSPGMDSVERSRTPEPRDSRDGLAACLRKTYPTPDPPTKLSASHKPALNLRNLCNLWAALSNQRKFYPATRSPIPAKLTINPASAIESR